jgi:hypothetical protein
MHARTDFPSDQRRLMLRTTVKGTDRADRLCGMTRAALSPRPSDDYLSAAIATGDASGTRLQGMWD